MDTSHLRDNGTAEAGCAHLRELGWRNPALAHSSRTGHLEYLLRHSPLWWTPDISSLHSHRKIVGALEFTRVDGGLPCSGRLTRSHPHFRNSFPVASRVDEPCSSRYYPRICSTVWRSCRSGNSEPASMLLSAR